MRLLSPSKKCTFLRDDESQGIMSPKLSLPAFVYEQLMKAGGGGGMLGWRRNFVWVAIQRFQGAEKEHPGKRSQRREPRGQRVLNDLYMTLLSCGRMIRLLAHPLPSLSWQQVVSLSQSPCVSLVELTDGRVGEGVCGGEPNHTTARKPGTS